MGGQPNRTAFEMLDHIPSAICVKNSDGVLIYANAEFANLIGVPAEKLLGRRAEKFLDAETASKSNHTDSCLQDDEQTLEVIANLRDSNGDDKIILVRKKHITLENGEIGIMATLTDISNFVHYEKELEEKHRELRRQQGKLKELATLDPLTGIYNRRAFYDMARETLDYARIGKLNVGVLMLDLDKFKNLNDTYGHAAGDEVLVRFSEILSECIRGSDIFARLGGEEFAVLLPDTPPAGVKNTGERIRAAVADAVVHFKGQDIRFTTSVGGSMWHPTEATIDAALSRADKHLYEAKAAGRNCLRFTEASTETAVA